MSDGRDAPSAFNVVASKGFQMTFANGWTVSVMFGRGNYCEHRFSGPHPDNRIMVGTEHDSNLAEVAAWRSEDRDFQVIGWQNADEVAAFIADVKGRTA